MSSIDTTAHSANKASWIGFFLGPAILLFCIFTTPPEGMSNNAWLTVGMAFLMAIWWATEAIPIPATSLMPILLIPLLGIGTIKSATAPYANDIIYLFLGGFVLGLSLQKWNLHRRIALKTLLAVGNNPRAQVAGFMIATAFISMWVSNTATAIMMLPIGLSIITMLTSEKDEPSEKERFATAILLGIAYASSIGGIATLIGTPPNGLLAAEIKNSYGIDLGFGQWMKLGLPLATVMLALAWWWLTRGGFKISGSAENSEKALKAELDKLGPISKPEILVLIIFLFTSAAWIFRPLIEEYIFSGLNDTIIAIAAAIVLFATPVDIKNRVFIMDWDTAKTLPWGVLLLFGGGLALSSAIGGSGLSEWIADAVQHNIGSLAPILVMFIICAIIMSLTEITSNTATAATFLPLMAALAISLNLHPMMLAIPTALSASFAFMMPVATPPNAIVFGTGKMKISSMIKSGFFLSISGVFLVTAASYFLIDKIWAIAGTPLTPEMDKELEVAKTALAPVMNMFC